jgi:predicted RNase H-like HicB family nuclease
VSVEPQEHHSYVEHYDGHTIVYDQGPTSWGAYVEDLPVCFSVGDTFEDTQRHIREAIAIYLDEQPPASTQE